MPAAVLRLTRLDLALMGLATLVAAFFRFYQIDAIPPGLHYDEAFEGLVAKELLETGQLKIFFEGNFGLEPLSVYLLAGLYLLFGVSATTVRLMPAIAGVLTVPALYLLVRELFPAGPWAMSWKTLGVSAQSISRTLALLSALALATLFWHISFSRYGVESNLVPLFEVVAYYFLWRAFRTNRLRTFVVSGVLFGLSLYTYQAARLIPVMLALFLFYRLLLDRRCFVETYWKGIVVLTIAAVVTFVPLGSYFVRHPEFLTLRAGQVQTIDRGQSTVDMLAGNAQKTLKMFLVRGDEDPRSNIPGRPAIDPFLAVPFVIGAAVVVFRVTYPQYGMLAIWFVVMLLPTVLSEYAPHFRRALGTTPVVAVVAALGLTSVLVAGFWLAKWVQDSLGTVLRAAVVTVIVVLVAASTVVTYRDYFLIWGRSSYLFAAFDVGIMDLVRYANGLPAGAEVFVSPVPRSHPTITFSTRKGRALKSFDGRRGFVLPASSDVDATYIVVVDEDTRSPALLQRYFPQLKPVREVKTWDGRPYFDVFSVSARSERRTTPPFPLQANLANKVDLMGYGIPRLEYKAGDVIPLLLFWQARETMKESYTVFTHLIGPWDEKNKTVVWGQKDGLPVGGTYLTRDWLKGDMILDEYALPIDKDAAAGEYEIEVGMYLLETMQRLPVIDITTGGPVDDRIILGKIWVDRP